MEEEGGKKAILFGELAMVQSSCQRDTYGYGEAAFGDCVAGVPLMYPDRNQIQSRAAAS